MTRRAGLVLAAVSMLGTAIAVADDDRSRRFDATRTQVLFKVGMRLPLRVEGRFDHAEGELETLPDQRLRVNARLDGRQLRIKGPDWMQKITLSDDFLDVQRFPHIHFESDSFEVARLVSGGELDGRLQLRGQQRAVRFELLPSGCARPGQDCDIQVHGHLNRHDFGMHSHRFTVRDEISFEFRIRLLEPAH